MYSVKRDRNILTVPDRIGELVGIILVVLVAAFFAYHLSADTGFMTSAFGTLGAVLLFGSAAASVMASGARAITGRRDKSRAYELASAIYWTIASLWFITVFPFNFSHLGDPLPYYLKLFVSWIPEWMWWIVMLVAVIASIGTAINAAVRMMMDRFNRPFA